MKRFNTKNKKIIIGFALLFIAIGIGILIGLNNSSSKKTLFIYMCGSNLETKQGLASQSINELLETSLGDKLNIVIETGGAKTWRSHNIVSNAIQRYEIKNGELKLIETLENSNMGSEKTLTDFLTWGQERYNTKHNMLILWDHGAGATKGISFDENYNFDSLSLFEIKTAFENARLKNKFEIIGFDACFMASIETVASVQNYANYMIASEDIEPSSGWDYTALAEAYVANGDPLEVGKKICDSYMEKSKESGNDLLSTLSIFDLFYTNDFLVQFEDIAKMISSDIQNAKVSYFTEAVHSTKNFGDGNMLDMLDYLSETNKYMSLNYVDMYSLCNGIFIPYKVYNEKRNISGVSFFYPVKYNDTEIKDYIKLGVSKNYNQFLTDVYLDAPAKALTFENRGSIDNDGNFVATISKEEPAHLGSISSLLMTTDKDGKKHVLSVGSDIIKDWDNMSFKSNFKGTTLALDGHRLSTTVLATSDEAISYIAPVIVNGKHTNLRFQFVFDVMGDRNSTGYYNIVGLSSGMDENGLIDKDIIPLRKGDRIEVLLDTTLEDGNITENYSEDFVVSSNDVQITEIPLDRGSYQYAFIATDIFGNTFTSDTTTFYLIP